MNVSQQSISVFRKVYTDHALGEKSNVENCVLDKFLIRLKQDMNIYLSENPSK